MDNEIFKETLRKISNQNSKNPEFLTNLPKEEYKKLIENMYLRFSNSGVIENEVVINNPKEFIEYISNMALDLDIKSYYFGNCPISVSKDRLGNLNVQANDFDLNKPLVIAYYSNSLNSNLLNSNESLLVYYSPKEKEREVSGEVYNRYYQYTDAMLTMVKDIRNKFLEYQGR